MSCNTKTSLAAVIDAVNAQLNNNYIDRDDPRINQGVFTEPTIRGGLMLDEAAKLDFCGFVHECGLQAPFGKQWIDRPLYPDSHLVSYDDGGEIKSKWSSFREDLEAEGVFDRGVLDTEVTVTSSMPGQEPRDQAAKNTETVSLTDFGPMGGGDNTDLVTKAIAALPDGGTILLPVGVCNVKGAILKPNIKFVGASRGGSIFNHFEQTGDSQMFATYTGTAPASAPYLEGVGFENLTLRSEVNQYSVVGPFSASVALLNPRGVAFRDCDIYMKSVAVNLESSQDKLNRDSKCSVLFDNCEFKYSRDPMDESIDGFAYINSTGAVAGVHVTNSQFNSARCRSYIRLFESEVDGGVIGSFNALISGNRFLRNLVPRVSKGDANGVYFRGDSSVIENNYFYNLEGNYIDHQSSEVLTSSDSEQIHKAVVVRNNTLKLDSSGNFQNNSLIHCRSSGVEIVGNHIQADWAGSPTRSPVIIAKWGDSVSIHDNEITVVGNTRVMLLSSSYIYGRQYRALKVKNNVIRCPGTSSVAAIEINTNGAALYADIEGNTFIGPTNAISARTYEYEGNYIFPRVRFVGNTGYSKAFLYTGMVDFQEVDGLLNLEVTVNAATGTANPSSTTPMNSLAQLATYLMPSSGLCKGSVTVTVEGAGDATTAVFAGETPNMNVRTTSAGGSVYGFSVSGSLNELAFTGVSFTRADSYPVALNSAYGGVRRVKLTNCTFSPANTRGLVAIGETTIYLTGVDFGATTDIVTSISQGARVFATGVTAPSGKMSVITGAEYIYTGTLPGGTITKNTLGRVTEVV